MTVLDEPPTVTAPSQRTPVSNRRSPVPAWAFASRLARREVRRRPGRTLLAALLIAVPVMAMTLGSVLARTNADDWSADFERDYGAADLVVGLPWFSVVAAAPTVSAPDVGDVIGEYVRLTTSITPAGGRAGESYWVDFTDVDFTNPNEAAGIEVTAGRAPEPGEVLLDADVADRLGVGIGDRLELERPSGAWIVSGFGQYRGNYWSSVFAVPGFDADRIRSEQRFETVLVDLPDTMSAQQVRAVSDQLGAIDRFDEPFSGASDLATGMAWGYVAGVLALVAVGIIVAAAFATSARRQLVTIGQLSANGAPASVVRRTLVLQGSWTGVIGSVVGVIAGFALLPVAVPIVEQHILYHDLRAVRVNVFDLVAIAVTAVVAASIAAAVPARSAARVPVMSALAGRRPTGTPPKWLVPTGLALFAGGLGLITMAAVGANGSGGSTNLWAAIVVLGATAMVLGVCCASPLVVERIGRLGRSASLSWRLALRSMSRARTRSAAVVAAIAVAVGGAVALSAVVEQALESNANCCPPAVPSDTVMFRAFSGGYAPEYEPNGSTLVDLDAPEPFEVPPIAADYLEQVEADVVAVDAATFDPEPFDAGYDYIDPFVGWIATPELLDAMSAPESTRRLLADGLAVELFTDHGEPIEMQAEYRAEGGTIILPTVAPTEPFPHALNGYGVLLTEAAARDAGFDIVRTAVMARFGRPLTSAELEDVRVVQYTLYDNPIDAFVEPGDAPIVESVEQAWAPTVEMSYDDPSWREGYGNDLWIARALIVGTALLVSLLVVAIGLALSAVEGRDERDAFVVTGARPSSMRRLTAARAAVIALVGIGLGVPLGYVPVWAVDKVTDDPYAVYTTSTRFPWLVVGTLVVVIPVLAAGGAWAASGVAHRFRPASPTRRD